MALGLDPDKYFQKERFSRMLIVGGYIADSAINSMRQYDMQKERERQAEVNRSRHR